VTLSTAQSPMSWSKAKAPRNMNSIVVTPEVSHAPMSSLKDDVDKTQLSAHDSPSIQSCRTQNNIDMSVTSEVSHVEM